MTGQTFKQEVVVDGKTLVVEGTIGINDIKVTVKTEGPPPPPPPPVDPNTGTIKEGARWSKNAGPATTWEAVAMTDEAKKGLWKIITHSDNDLNVIADIPSKEIALQLIEHFKTHKFPPDGGENPPPPPPPPPPTGETDEVEGIKLPYKSTGKKRTDDWHYNENNGLRIDYEGNKAPDFVNNAMVVYAQFVGPITEKEDRCFKWTWGHHSKDGDIADCYIVLVRNGDGATRVRFEHEHPSGYSDLQGYGEGKLGNGLPAKTGQIWGLMGVRRNVVGADGKAKGVRLELYEDMGGFKDGKPANEWKKVIDYLDTKLMITDYSKNGIEITCRMDDDKGDKNIKVEKVLLAEVGPASA